MELTIIMISLGLIFHQMIYISSKGWEHFSDRSMNFVNLGQRNIHKTIVNISLIVFCITTIVNPTSKVSLIGLFISLTLVILFFPKRISNHLALAFFSIMPFVFINDLDERVWILQCITVILYFFVTFHKLNVNFFKKNSSIGYGVTVHYLLQRFGGKGKLPNNLIFFISTYFIVTVEGIVFLLLFLNYDLSLAMALALMLHFAFGYLAHYHFSTIMLGLLLSFMPNASLNELIATFETHSVAIFLLSAFSFFTFSNHKSYRLSEISCIGNILFSVIFWTTSFLIMDNNSTLNSIVISLSHNSHSYIIVSMAFLNGISPYIGIKNEFSYAMFSNLHPIYYTHFIIKHKLTRNMFTPRYYKVISYHIIDNKNHGKSYDIFKQYVYDFSGEYMHIRIINDWKEELQSQGIKYEIFLQEYQGNSNIDINNIRIKFHERALLFPAFIPANIKTPYFL